MSGFFLTLYLDLDHPEQGCPEGPGWYLDVRNEYGTVDIAPRVKISPQEAEAFGRLAESTIDGKTLNWRPELSSDREATISELLQSGTEEARMTAQRMLDEAEEWAKKIASLRRSLQELDGSS